MRVAVLPGFNVLRGTSDARHMDSEKQGFRMILTLPPPAVTPTRSAALVMTVNEVAYPRQSPADLDYWPGGIDYEGVSLPTPDPRGAFKDSLDVLHLLED
jgi:hypothetical protein